MLVFKKSQIVTVLMVCLLVVAGYINLTYTDKPEDENLPVSEIISNEEVENYGEAKFVNASNDAKIDYFNQTQMNKEKARSEAMALIKGVAESDNAEISAKKTAQESMIEMAKSIEKEANIENILMGKGFEKVSAYINNGGITLAVLTNGLSASDVAVIRDAVIGETGFNADKIKIMEIK